MRFICSYVPEARKPEAGTGDGTFFAYAFAEGKSIRYACQRLDNYAEVSEGGKVQYVPLLALGREIEACGGNKTCLEN